MGIVIERRDDWSRFTVAKVTPDGQAAGAGVLVGDLLVELEKTDIQEHIEKTDLLALIDSVRGPEKDIPVTIGFVRPAKVPPETIFTGIISPRVPNESG
jgi:hypothetical protein